MARPGLLAAAALAALLLPAAVPAQEMLTLDRAVEEMLVHNAALRAARAESAAGAARVTAARSGWLPRISVAESWQRGDQPVFVFSSLLSARRFAAANFAIDALNHPDPIGFFRASVGIDQVLFDGGRRRAAVESASIGREIAELGVDQAAAARVLTTTEAFGRILAAEARGRAVAAALEAAREDLAHAERRRDAGMATDADVLALAAHAADLEQGAIQSASDAAIARAELNRLMGAPVDRAYGVVQPSDAANPDAANGSLEALLAEADRTRPEARRAAAAQRLSEAGRRSARAALIPQVAAQAAFDVSGTRFGDRASEWVVGAEVRWSFSLGGAELAEARAAANRRAQADAEAEEARAAVHVEVVTALRRLEAARARQIAGQAAVEQATEGQRIIRDRFDAGVAGVGDVLRASSTLLDAQAQRISAVVDAMVGSAMLRHALWRQP